MAQTLTRPTPPAARRDPGAALLELLGFADTIRAGRPPRPREPLAFPPLARVAGQQHATASAARDR